MDFAILAEGAHTAAGQAVVHEALWEWALAFIVLVGYTAYEIIGGRKVAEPTLAQAARRWATSFMVAIAFGVFIWMRHGAQALSEYTAGFFVEYGLSVDNIAVWVQVLIAFVFFRGYHRKLLMFGVLMTIALRVVFIFVGVALMARLAILTVLMGLFLIYTAKKLVAESDDEDFRLEENRAFRIVTKVLPYTPERYGTAFVTRQAGGFKLTPLGVGGIIFGFVDIMFAIDSIPAILSITQDKYLVATSNMMAVLGLMSLYFVFDSIKNRISKLNEGLAIILAFVGIKMLIGSELFWDVVWNGYEISWKFVGITAAVLYGLWLLIGLTKTIRLFRNRAKRVDESEKLTMGEKFKLVRQTFGRPKKITIFLVVLENLKLLADWTELNHLKQAVWHAHEVEINSWVSLAFILLVLVGAYVWGLIWPEEEQTAATVRQELDHTGKLINLEPIEDKLSPAALSS